MNKAIMPMTALAEISSGNLSEQLAFVVLAGGKSRRMGQDKATMKLACLPDSFLLHHDYLTYSSKENAILNELDFLWQSLWTVSKLVQKLSFVDKQVYLSCRFDQKEFFQNHIRSYPNLAPVEFICDAGNGICDAFVTCFEYLNKNIFCLPCDAPFVTEENILQLIILWQEKIKSNVAENIFQYTYVDPENGRKETIISLYTQGAKQAFCEAMEKKVRVQNTLSDEHCLCIPFTGNLRKELFNFNTPNDFNYL